MNTDIEKVKNSFWDILCMSDDLCKLSLDRWYLERHSVDIEFVIGMMKTHSKIIRWIGDFDLEGLFKDSIRTKEYVNEAGNYCFTYIDTKSEVFRYNGLSYDRVEVDEKDSIIVDEIPWEFFFSSISRLIKMYNEYHNRMKSDFPKYKFNKLNYCSRESWDRSYEYFRDVYCWFLSRIRIFFENVGLKSFIDFVDRSGGFNNVEYEVVKRFPSGGRSYSAEWGNDRNRLSEGKRFKFMSLYDYLKENGEITSRCIQSK